MQINSIDKNCYIKFYGIPNSKNQTKITFKGQNTDSFERISNFKKFEMSVYNPYLSEAYNYDTVNIDLSKPQIIELGKNTKPRYADRKLTLDYDPDRTGILTDKITGKQIKSVVLKSKDDKYKDIFAYHFMSEDLEKEFGYISLENCFKPTIEKLYLQYDLIRDYPKLGVTGPRVFVLYLKNLTNGKIGGVGKLADKYTVKHCLENGIEPNVVSEAGPLSHVAHYLKGKRFLPLEPNSYAADFFQKRFATTNVNKILSMLIARYEKNGMYIDLRGWPIVPMYMPLNIIKKYTKELKAENLLPKI